MNFVEMEASEYDTLMCTSFPNLYRNRYADMRTTAMCWGFEIGPGWRKLVYDLSTKLEPIIAQWKKEYPEEEYFPCASQVKEKYGTLRFYMTSATDEMWNLTEEAESASSTICETCGAPGKLAGYSWYYTTCPTHLREDDKYTKDYFNEDGSEKN